MGYGETYQLEKYDEETKDYNECSLSEDFDGFEEIYSYSAPGSEINRRVELKYFEDIVPGKYRLVVKVNFFENTEPFDEAESITVDGKSGVVLCAEFILK